MNSSVLHPDWLNRYGDLGRSAVSRTPASILTSLRAPSRVAHSRPSRTTLAGLCAHFHARDSLALCCGKPETGRTCSRLQAVRPGTIVRRFNHPRRV